MKPGSAIDKVAATIIAALFVASSSILAIFALLRGEWHHVSTLLVVLCYIACTLGLAFSVVNTAFIAPMCDEADRRFLKENAARIRLVLHRRAMQSWNVERLHGRSSNTQRV